MKMTPEQVATTEQGIVTIVRRLRELDDDHTMAADAMSRHESAGTNDEAIGYARAVVILGRLIEAGERHLADGARMLQMHEIAVRDEAKREANVVALEGKACDP